MGDVLVVGVHSDGKAFLIIRLKVLISRLKWLIIRLNLPIVG